MMKIRSFCAWFGMALCAMMVLTIPAFAQSEDTTVVADMPPAPEREKDWLFQCETEGEEKTCEVLYVADIAINDQKLPIFRFSVSKTKEDNHYGIFYFPYSVDFFLGAKPRIYVDGRKLDDVPWINCTAQGCWAHKKLSNKFVNRLKRGREGVLRLVLLDGRNLDVKFSLMGVTAALNKL